VNTVVTLKYSLLYNVIVTSKVVSSEIVTSQLVTLYAIKFTFFRSSWGLRQEVTSMFKCLKLELNVKIANFNYSLSIFQTRFNRKWYFVSPVYRRQRFMSAVNSALKKLVRASFDICEAPYNLDDKLMEMEDWWKKKWERSILDLAIPFDI
jgi:hypothetical protein